MTLEELKEKIAKPHKDYKSVDEKLSNFYDFQKLADGRGVYAISADIDKIENEEVLKCIKQNSTQKNVIYIGNVTDRNIFIRCKEDITGGTAIFFRKIGSVLGFESKSRNSKKKIKNFTFKEEDRKKIKEWNYANLRLEIFDTDNNNEEGLIKHFKPAFNAKYNDYKCKEISNLIKDNKGGSG